MSSFCSGWFNEVLGCKKKFFLNIFGVISFIYKVMLEEIKKLICFDFF